MPRARAISYTSPMTSISQLQMSYSAAEDRLLLRLNTNQHEEFRFWLTRRYAQLLIQALHAHNEADPDVAAQVMPEAKKAVQEFKQEAATKQGNFKDAFKESEAYPLGESPILAFKLSYKLTNGKLALTIEPKEGAGVNLVLDRTLNLNFSRLLRTSESKAGWMLNWGAQAPDSAAQTRVIN